VAPRKSLGFYLASGWLGLVILISFIGDMLPLPGLDEYDFDNAAAGLFSGKHILGTDLDGLDILSGIVHGTRMSIIISFVCVSVAMVLGGALGILAAYWRGWVDSVITMYFNVTLSIPNLILTFAMVAVLSTPTTDDPNGRIPRVLVLIIALTFALIPILGRLARSAALSWTGREFVQVAESIGMKRRNIMWSHIVPNVIPSMMSVGFLAAGVVIVIEGGLAILGVGTDPGDSWGSLLAKNRPQIVDCPQAVLIPAIAVALTVMALNFFGDYFRKRIDNRESRI
jgi:peptide/nickel transport system permease protein